MGKGPDKHVNFWDGLGLPNCFPDGRVGWDSGNVYYEAIALCCGVGLGVPSPASFVLSFFFEGGFPLKTDL